MGKIIIQEHTTKYPITLIGEQAGVCYNTDITNKEKNFQRGLDCLKANHGRTTEFPDVYMIIEGYSARVIREWYTHIGGAPTRLQASTRYINYQKGFDYVTPKTIVANPAANEIYKNCMIQIQNSLRQLEEIGIHKEDSAMLLPLGMETTIVCKHNLRNLISMSHVRECTRAYWEYRDLFKDLKDTLKEYSSEWEYLVNNYFKPKCEIYNQCTEKNPCRKEFI